VRRYGFAVNSQATESGLTAVGVAVPGRAALPRAAISLAMPTVRYSRDRLHGWAAVLSAAADELVRDAAAG
jgi:DNA-binding IclR family transcriptional regulator